MSDQEIPTPAEVTEEQRRQLAARLDERVEAALEAARRRQATRVELAQQLRKARDAGLSQRHAEKLRRLAGVEIEPGRPREERSSGADEGS